MICPKCRTQNPDNQQYCINCGYKLFEVKNVLGKVCPQCGRINPIDQKRCINCHADLTKIAGHTVQRQVSTIYQPKRRKWLTIVGAVLGILMIVLGTYQGLKHYGIAVQTVETLEVQRYDQHHRRVKTFYIATKVSSAYYKRVGNHYYYHGVTCHTYNEANRLSGRQLETIYRRDPARRTIIIATKQLGDRFKQICYPARAKAYFKVGPRNDDSYSLCRVHLAGQTYTDHIYVRSGTVN